MLKKKIKLMKISYIFNFLFLLVLNILFVFLVFFINKHLVLVLDSFKSIKDEYIYIMNPSTYVLEKTSGIVNTAYYQYDLFLVNGKETVVINMNKKALEFGIPIFDTHFYSIELNNPNDFLYDFVYTNNAEKAVGDIHFNSDIEIPKLSSLFNSNSDNEVYIILRNEGYFDGGTKSMIITPNNAELINTIELRQPINEYVEDSCVFQGEQLKNYQITLYKSFYVFLLVFAILPLIMVFFANRNMYTYQVNLRAREITIKHIFYASKKQIVWEYFFELFQISCVAILIASIIGYVISYSTDIVFFFIVLLLAVAINGFILFFVANGTIKAMFKKSSNELFKVVRV